MKKTLVFGTAMAAALFFAGCKAKEVVAPTVTQELYPSPSVKIGFSVHVLASSEAARTAGLDGATVIVKQNGNTYSSSTDESGIATFGGLTEGTVRWYVKKEGFASINGTANLVYTGSPVVDGVNGTTTSGNSVTVNNEQTSSTTVEVTIPKNGATVTGTLMADLDGNGAGQSAVLASGTVKLILPNSFEPNVYTTSVSNGVYSFANLPEGVDFTLETVDVFATIAAAGAVPSFKTNLNFPGNLDNGTTPSVGKTLQRGLVTLQ